MTVWADIAGFLEEHGSCAIVTVVELFGSGPREIGARLVVAPDGTFAGTIGGGTLEWQALAAAQAMLPARTQSISERKYGLGPDRGQCCGGYVTLTYELLTDADLRFARRAARAEARGPIRVESRYDQPEVPRKLADAEPGRETHADYIPGQKLSALFGKTLTPVYLFGAGHVGQALAAILETLPVRLMWVDSRDIPVNRDFPYNVTYKSPSDPQDEIGDIPAGAYVFVMTHSHALDFDLCHGALHGGRARYVGVIGSKTKRARFDKRLRDSGLSDERMARFHSPLGLDAIRGKEPAVIAVSVAADLMRRIEAAEAAEKKSPPVTEQEQAVEQG